MTELLPTVYLEKNSGEGPTVHLYAEDRSSWKNAVSGLYLSNGETSEVSISQKDC